MADGQIDIEKTRQNWGIFAWFFGPFLRDLPDILRKWPVKKLRIFLQKNPTNRVE